MKTMSTERLVKVTAADTSGNVIEWYVEPGSGKLAYFTEQQEITARVVVADRQAI